MAENDGFIGTGVFATEEQQKEIDKALGSGISVGFGLFSAMHPDRYHEKVHSYALAQGLPDYTGFYGYNKDTHEFLAPVGWKRDDWVDWDGRTLPDSHPGYTTCSSGSCETTCQGACEGACELACQAGETVSPGGPTCEGSTEVGQESANQDSIPWPVCLYCGAELDIPAGYPQPVATTCPKCGYTQPCPSELAQVPPDSGCSSGCETMVETTRGAYMEDQLRKHEAYLGVDLVAEERLRQIIEEGFDSDHDDTHKDRQLAQAAAHFIDPSGKAPWPSTWAWSWNKRSLDGQHSLSLEAFMHKGQVYLLVKAGAMICAEIDRLLRLERANKSGPPKSSGGVGRLQDGDADTWGQGSP